MKKISVRSRTEATEFKSEEPWIAISISSHGQWPVLSEANRVGLLQLAFQDIEFQSRSGAISPNQAEEILKFVETHKNVDNILVHCEAGTSRSPAIAAAIANIYNKGEDKIWFHEPYIPNKLVYNAVLKAADRVF